MDYFLTAYPLFSTTYHLFSTACTQIRELTLVSYSVFCYLCKAQGTNLRPYEIRRVHNIYKQKHSI